MIKNTMTQNKINKLIKHNIKQQKKSQSTKTV